MHSGGAACLASGEGWPPGRPASLWPHLGVTDESRGLRVGAGGGGWPGISPAAVSPGAEAAL